MNIINTDLLRQLPYEIIISNILSFIEYTIYNRNQLKIKNMYGYFKKNENIWIYQIWIHLVINTPKIETIPQLNQLTSLTIRNCNKIETIRCAQAHPKLHNSVAVCDLPQLNQLTSLTLKYSNKIETIPQLNKLTYLKLYRCHKIETIMIIPQLNQLISLTLFKCDKIETIMIIPQLNQLTSLSLEYCEKLKTISTKQKIEIETYLLQYI